MEFLRDILEEHLEEADFLYTQRRAALDDDDYVLAELAELEERLLAHVDGLVVAGDEGWELLQEKLTGDDEGEAFVAALAGLASADAERRAEVLAALASADDETRPGLQAALSLYAASDLVDPLRELVAEAEAPAAAAVLEILAAVGRGLAPEELHHVLETDDDRIRSAGLRAAVGMGWREFADPAVRFLESEDPGLLAEAARACFVFGREEGLDRCRKLLAAGEEAAAALQIWLGLAGEARDGALLAAGLGDESLGRGAVMALGWCGRAEAVDALLGQRDNPDLARQVAEALRRVTGVDLAAAGLVREGGPEPDDERDAVDSGESATEEDAEDPDEFVIDPDEHLPWPDPDRLFLWWTENRSRFGDGRRYRLGRAFDREAVLAVLREGGLAERRLAACELARLAEEGPLFEGTALAWRQRQVLAKLETG